MKRLALAVALFGVLAACGAATTNPGGDIANRTPNTETVTPRVVIPSGNNTSGQCTGRPPKVDQGVTGLVMLGACAGGPCGAPDLPLHGAVIRASGRTVQETKSVCGRYALRLEQGHYTISVTGGRPVGYPDDVSGIDCPTQRATVVASVSDLSFFCRR